MAASSICIAMSANNKQTVVITEASSGIDLDLTHGFLEAGFHVAASSRNVTRSQRLTAGGNLLLVDGDVGDPATARNLIQSAGQRFGRIDVVINNANIFVPKPFT